ncbi:acyclic terpene utilization AtuA family protein [Chloroflexota bacterium]
MRFIRLGSGTGYWGDKLDASEVLVERGNISYLAADMLAELTLSIHQRIREKNPKLGYVQQIEPLFRGVLKTSVDKGIKIITNGGAANPEGGGEAVAAIAKEIGISGLKIGVVVGDDILPTLDASRAKGWKFTNLDTGEEDVERIRGKIVAANVYTGADRVIEGLKEGCQVIIAGRLSDNSMYVGPIMYEHGWDYTGPYVNRIASAIVVAHLLECSSASTGALCSTWQEIPEPWKIGHPIAEVYENGEAIITKPPDTGGRVNQWTIKEQLVYEVHDPNNYIMPDGIADFTSVKLEEVGPDQVKISQIKGKPRPDNLKVCIGYRDGFITETGAYVIWPNAWEKAQALAEIIRRRAKDVYHIEAEDFLVDFVGVNTLAGPTAPPPDPDINEIMVRIAVKTRDATEAAKVRALGGDVAGMGLPAGTSFHTPMGTRPVFSLWPTLVPRSEVNDKLIVKKAE